MSLSSDSSAHENLGSPCASHGLGLLDVGDEHTQRVVQRTFRFVQNLLRRAAQNHRTGLTYRLIHEIFQSFGRKNLVDLITAKRISLWEKSL